ncbi:uracil-DNA glycosylase [Vineibacter terrae]|uniref:uracil-DNA glycosylase n=1 Tax=Vineibacter terrae TaxID=2586908 RepID=UPI002E35B26E|nr:uracil-DNA glycosylase [Vineibacter terrae]HEX2889524.1 uracil-DNA glycosylase [Vineibacter terrae]
MNSLPSATNIAALLRWYAEAGVDEAIGEAALDRYEATAALAARPATPPASVPARAAPAAPPPAAAPPRTSAPVRATPAVPLESPQLVEDARTTAARAESLIELEAAIGAFEGCSLKRLAKNTVFADGAADAPVMVVGEAPGEDEDRQGKPFVGVSGRLMDRMFAAIGLTRERDVYITNILNWRPPGNRTPNLSDVAICVAFARRHIELKRPRLLVLAGGVPAKSLLETETGITRLRGRWFEYTLPDGTRIPTMPMFHPAYLLRTPSGKRQTWIDLLNIRERLDQILAT